MSDSKPAPAAAPAASAGHTSSIADQIRLRESKADALRQRGGHPYGNGVAVPHGTGLVKARHGQHDAAALEAQHSETYALAGRVMAVRSMGKVTFVSLRDRDGDLQLFVRKDKVGEAAYEELKLLDLGDLVCAWGRALRTKTGELSIAAGEKGTTEVPKVAGAAPRPGFQLLAKALRPLPEKWHGLSDVETRYRQRYVDLAVNLEVREAFRKRARMISALRAFLDARGYIEVETPVLHKAEEAGGAAARPFATHHNALDLDLKMRIATELHLKRLIVGGLERVYEIGRIFRNEGIDRRHNPEFTSIEFYQAYATYEDLMKLTEELVCELAKTVSGSAVLPYQGVNIDYTAPWPRVSMLGEVVKVHEELSEDRGGVPRGTSELPQSAQLDRLRDAFERTGGRHADIGKPALETLDLIQGKREAHTLGAYIALIFETECEARLPKDRPCFVVDFPLEVSPLARKRDGEPRLVDRFEAYAGGMEIANAFSELNDPRDQEARFRAQVEAAKAGDAEAMPYDRDFVRALEHGMPPTAGEGIGIDRLAMLFTDAASIRDVILFPLLKPQAEEWDEASGEGR